MDKTRCLSARSSLVAYQHAASLSSSLVVVSARSALQCSVDVDGEVVCPCSLSAGAVDRKQARLTNVGLPGVSPVLLGRGGA
jgi:hypothetical protein